MAKKKQIDPTFSAEPLSATRKLEILGIVLMALAVLVGLSIFTYSAGDYSILKSVSFSDLFKDRGPALRIQNGLGPIGAYFGHFFVYVTFGYPSLIIAYLIGQLGWYIFRSKPVSELSWLSVYMFCVLLLTSIVIGWFQYTLEWDSIVWNGWFGLGSAKILRLITGIYGSAILLFVTAIITFLIGIDRDVQVTIDRFSTKWQELQDRFAAFRENRAELSEQKAAEKLIEKQRKAEEKEAQKQAQPQLETPKPSHTEVAKPIRKPEPIPMPEKKPEPEVETDFIKNRAIIDRKPTTVQTPEPPKPPTPSIDEDGLEIKVFVGEEEEEAKSGDLDKLHRDQGKDSIEIRYKFPTLDLLDVPPDDGKEINYDEINAKKKIILEKLKLYGIEIIDINAIVGPTVTLYELTPAPDVKISKIESYANDLKLAMEAHGLRIIAPIPGKGAVGIEVPNDHRQTVYIRQMINSKKFVESDMKLPVAFGKTIENENFMVDLTKMPHLLVAGATGSGKSVGINTIITCLLYKCHPDNLKFVLVDPKKIELSLYQNIEKHFLATLPNAEESIITDTSKVLEVLTSVCKEMDDRYDLLKMAMVRDIASYNDKFKKGALENDLGHRHLPYIVVIIDELADLMMTAGKQIEEPIARLAQLARAIGIHLVVATQRPSVNVITGTIKANFPSRIAYQVASKIDSRTILDTMGADQLVGRGDMLFSGGGPMIRVQNAFVSTEEVEKITAFIGNQLGYDTPYHLPLIEEEGHIDTDVLSRDERDALFEDAARTVVLHQQGSVSLLQRKLKLGYNRAGRIIDQLYAAGVVGPYQGSTARDVLVQDEDELEEMLRTLD